MLAFFGWFFGLWFMAAFFGFINWRDEVADRRIREAEDKRAEERAERNLARIKARCDADPEFKGLCENIGPDLAESYMNQRIAERLRFASITASGDCSRNPSPN